MEGVVAILNHPLIVMAIQLGVGWAVKNQSGVVNKAIPLINYVVGVLVQLPGVAFQPASDVNVSAGFLGAAGSFFTNPLFTSLIYTLLSTGAHSSTKNVAQLLKQIGVVSPQQ